MLVFTTVYAVLHHVGCNDLATTRWVNGATTACRVLPNMAHQTGPNKTSEANVKLTAFRPLCKDGTAQVTRGARQSNVNCIYRSSLPRLLMHICLV